MGKLKVEDLKRIKESLKGTVNLRDGQHRVKITVHMGTCGIAAGARKIMDALFNRLEESGADNIMLTTSGCAGLCNHEPMLTVEVKDTTPVKYINLNEKKVLQIFDEHVMNNNPVVDFALSQGSETTY
jgi:NADP-reducing hydrogenase subunit HndB